MKRLLLKMALLVAAVLPLQAAIGMRMHRRASMRRDAMDLHRQANVTTIHFGDSVQRAVSKADRDFRNLHQMLQDSMAGERLGAVQQDASPMEVYLACAHYLARQDRRPLRLLIPVNLRSFSLEWDLRPEYQDRSEELRLRYGNLVDRCFQTPLSLWKIFPLNPISREEYLRIPVMVDDRKIATVAELADGSGAAPGRTRLESQFLFRYGYTLKPEHRKVRAMEAIVVTCRAAGMEPYFFINPVDVAAAERAAGPFLRERIARNVRTIRDRMAERKAKLLDLSASLESDDFDWAWTGSPNEHLNERGRRAVARELAAFLRGG